MIFAILFVVAFLIGLVIYWLSERWLVAVLVSMALFTVTTVADTEASDRWLFTLVFGLPIVFFASLLGAYVVQIRRGEAIELDAEEASLHEDSTSPKDNS